MDILALAAREPKLDLSELKGAAAPRADERLAGPDHKPAAGGLNTHIVEQYNRGREANGPKGAGPGKGRVRGRGRRMRRRNGPPREPAGPMHNGGYGPATGPYAASYAPQYPPNRRFGRAPRTSGGRPQRRNDPVFAFLAGLERKKIDAKELQKAADVSTQLLALRRPQRPRSALAVFMKETRTQDPSLNGTAIRKLWDAMPEKEKTQRLEKAWQELQEHKAQLQDYNKKRAALEGELRAVEGREPTLRPAKSASSYELFWKDVETKVRAEMPQATPYEVDIKRRSLWGELSKDEKDLYILRAQIEREDVVHAFRMSSMKAKTQALREQIAASALQSKPKAA